jgi:CBS domain containing-hemolysin-like protein
MPAESICWSWSVWGTDTRLAGAALMVDLLGVLLTVLLLGANAFFVGSEFALISARRDRLEALSERGKHRAVAVMRAAERLSLMLAGAQLGITVCSILLGRIGEPAIAHLLEEPFHRVGIPGTLLHTLSFIIALTLVVVLHVLLGEMVPKNIAVAGPETTAMLLIPAYLIWMRVARPIIAFYNWCANVALRAMGVQVKDELDITVSTVELAAMIAESRSEGLLDSEEHFRLTRALQIRDRVVADLAVPLDQIRAVPVAAAGGGPTVHAIAGAVAETGYSRFPITELSGEFIGYLHVKDVLPLIDDPDAVVERATVRLLPRVRDIMPLPEALSTLRRSNSHLALITNAHGDVVAMVALEDLFENLVGAIRDGTHRI